MEFLLEWNEIHFFQEKLLRSYSSPSIDPSTNQLINHKMIGFPIKVIAVMKEDIILRKSMENFPAITALISKVSFLNMCNVICSP